MKKLLTILCLVLLVSCSNEVPSDKLVERDGITYEVNSTTPFTGSSIGYHENGQLKTRENYKDGELEGPYEYYYSNGKLQQQGYYETYYSIVGGLKSVTMYKDGGEIEQRSMDENGQLKHKTNLKDGKLHGLWESFHENGQLKEKRNYKDGKEDGLRETFHENGKLDSKMCWRDGIPTRFKCKN